MRFILYYRGPLPSNGSPMEKHFIREAIHPQIVQVWSIPPLDGVAHIHLNNDDPEHNLFTEVDGHLFGCLVSSKIHCTAEIDITLLRPEEPGALLAQGGDIDNRLKTLLDALSVPANLQQLPPEFNPGPDQSPFFCLLQDDALVTGLHVRTERWLNPGAVAASEVVLLIRVETSTSKKTFSNLDFA